MESGQQLPRLRVPTPGRFDYVRYDDKATIAQAELFEVGDGMWRQEAVALIETKLVDLLDGASEKLPVFA